MSRDAGLYLADIVEACKRIERIASGRSDQDLVTDEIVLDAVRNKVPELRRAIEVALASRLERRRVTPALGRVAPPTA